MPRTDRRSRLPGQWLRDVAQRFCSPATLEHLVDPNLADLQHEWSRAGGRTSRAGADLD